MAAEPIAWRVPGARARTPSQRSQTTSVPGGEAPHEIVARLLRERRLVLAAPLDLEQRVCRLAAREIGAGAAPGGFGCDPRRPVLFVTAARARSLDQARALTSRGVPAIALGGRPRQALARLDAAGGEADWIFLTPEMITRASLRGRLAALRCPLVVIDHAHRASARDGELIAPYRALPRLLAALPEAARLLLCGAAPPGACADAVGELGLDPSTERVVAGFERPNLTLRVLETAGRREPAQAVDALLDAGVGPPGTARGGALVVAGTRHDAEHEAARLARRGHRALPLHAGLPQPRRARLRRAFARGRFEVAVVGEGLVGELERQDLRVVVFREPPVSIERFCEAAWRAGADGRPATAGLLVAAGAAARRRRRLERESIGLARAVLEARWARFLELLALFYSNECRLGATLRALGAPSAEPCGRCDVCAGRPAAGSARRPTQPRERVAPWCPSI